MEDGLRLYSATVRFIGTSQEEAYALTNIIQDELLRNMGFPSTDGTIQIDIEDVTDNQKVRNKIRFKPWRK